MKLIKNKSLIYLLLILGFLGFLDATYLTILHYKNLIPPCTVTHGCETVLTGTYSTVLGIPISLPGTLFYIAVMVLGILLLTNSKKLFLNLLLLLSTSGVLASLILIYIQLGIIKAYCQYCIISEAIMFLIFGATVFLKFKLKSN